MIVELKRTVVIRLRAATEHVAAFEALRPRVTGAYNDAAAYAWEHNVPGAVDLHHAVYRDLRERYGLPSQFMCNLQRIAMGNVASARAQRDKGGDPACPHSEQRSIPYDRRTMRLRPDRKSASFTTLGPRIEVELIEHRLMRRYADWQVDSGRVHQDARGRWVLTLCFTKDVPEPVPNPTSPVVGCDRGIVVPAVLSTGKFLGARHWHAVDRRYLRTQTTLQRKGTKSAKRRLKARAGKWSRFRAWCDHNVTKKILDVLPSGTTLVLEDLTNIRVRGRRFNRHTRKRLHSWSFRRQQEMLAYKAPERGIALAFVDPHYTSQKCSRCSHVDKKNRYRTRFVCVQCGHAEHADLNAARNIAANWLASQQTGEPPVVVNPPHAAPTQKTCSPKAGRPRSGGAAKGSGQHRLAPKSPVL